MSVLDKLNRTVWAFRHKFSPIPEYDFDSEGEIVQKYTPIKWSRNAIVELVVSGCFGTVIGIFVAFFINGAFVELLLSTSFSVYFGLLYILLGCLIMKKTISAAKSTNLHPDEVEAAKKPQRHLIVLAIMSIGTGIFCFLFNVDVILELKTWLRILLFTFLGLAFSFGLTYGIVDILNFSFGFFRPESSRPLVESVLQIYVVIIASMCMGASFGFLFGWVDFDEMVYEMTINPKSYRQSSSQELHLASMVDLHHALIIGGFWGLLAGLMNEYIRRVELAFNRLDHPIEFEAEI